MTKKIDKTKKEEGKRDVPASAPVFDVSKPGETAASPTSRPIIVGHKSMLTKDPMMSSEEEEDDENKKVEVKKDVSGKPKRETKIEPVDMPNKEPSAQETDKPDGDTPELPEEAPKPSQAGAVDALAGEVTTKRTQQKAEEEYVRKKAEIEKLIASKKYYLPIHDTLVGSSSAFNWFINTLLIVLLLAVGVILAQDAGYLDMDLELPFDLL